MPLGSYPDVQSPWGLWDASGGAAEWTEEIIDWGEGPRFRIVEGSWAGAHVSYSSLDAAYGYTADTPQFDFHYGLRVASSVPTSPALLVILMGVSHSFFPNRKRK